MPHHNDIAAEGRSGRALRCNILPSGVGVDQKAFLTWNAGRVAEPSVIDSKDVAAGYETMIDSLDWMYTEVHSPV